MTTPSILSTNSTTNNRLNVRQNIEGDVYVRKDTVSIASGTTTTTAVALMPIFKGERILNLQVKSDTILNASTTMTFGIYYSDSTLSASESTTGLIATASTMPQSTTAVALYPAATGGGTYGIGYTALGDGWIIGVVAGANTSATGILTTVATLDYGTNEA